jgi:uncharacterized membrane protein
MYDNFINFRKIPLLELLHDIEQKVDEASSGFSISIENIFQVGFNQFRKAPGQFILYTVIAFVALSNPFSGLLLGGPVITGYYIVAHQLKRTESAEVTGFFRGFDKFVPLLILNLLMSVVIFLGFLLLVIPGIYYSVSYLFSHFFVWFYDITPSEATGMSRKMVSGNFTQILFLWLALAGINILGAMAFGVGLLLTVPFSACVIHAAFDDIIGIP